jgi:hypothetical protein
MFAMLKHLADWDKGCWRICSGMYQNHLVNPPMAGRFKASVKGSSEVPLFPTLHVIEFGCENFLTPCTWLCVVMAS